MSEKKTDKTKTATEQPVNDARRRLLRMAIYVPPVVIGSIALTQAGCQPEPCSCEPSGGPGCMVGAPKPKSDPNAVDTSGQATEQ
ncbi:MAG: hypothetical protein ABI175_21865 [Polyangiales bacterium]